MIRKTPVLPYLFWNWCSPFTFIYTVYYLALIWMSNQVLQLCLCLLVLFLRHHQPIEEIFGRSTLC